MELSSFKVKVKSLVSRKAQEMLFESDPKSYLEKREERGRGRHGGDFEKRKRIAKDLSADEAKKEKTREGTVESLWGLELGHCLWDTVFH